MEHFTFKKITHLSEAQAIWKSLSPNRILFDDWNFRYSYYKYFMYPLYFLTAYYRGKPIGLLPLMWNEERSYLEFFASFGYMESNSVFVQPGYESCIGQLIARIDRPALLEYMTPSCRTIRHSVIHDYEYYANLTGLNDYHDFINTNLTGDKKRNLLSQFKKLENIHIMIDTGTQKDLDYLIYWNKVRFGEHSSYHRRPHFEAFLKNIGSYFDTRIITAKLNGRIEGVGLVVFYKNICFGINSGYNPQISNLGKYISMHKINTAIKAGKVRYAAGTGSPNWKEDFNLLKNPQYLLDLRSSFTHAML